MQIHIILLEKCPRWIDLDLISVILSNSRYWNFSLIKELENFSYSHFSKVISKVKKMNIYGVSIEERHQKILDYFLPFIKSDNMKLIILTKKQLPHSYFSITNGKNITIISYNNWTTLFSDLSFELIIIKEILASCLLYSREHSNKKLFHKQTKGCLYDYCFKIQELRASLWGHLCGDCRTYLRSTNVSNIKQDEVLLLIKLAISKVNEEKEVLHMLKIPKVFISYGKEDKETVKKLYNFLHSNGFNVWLDENELLPGDYWENVINNSIKETDYFLMCLSSKTVSKFGYFNKEIKKAFEIQRYYPINTAFIMPLRLDKFEIPDWLKHIHCADIFPESLSKFEKLANDIKQQHKKRMLSNR